MPVYSGCSDFADSASPYFFALLDLKNLKEGDAALFFSSNGSMDIKRLDNGAVREGRRVGRDRVGQQNKGVQAGLGQQTETALVAGR